MSTGREQGPTHLSEQTPEVIPPDTLQYPISNWAAPRLPTGSQVMDFHQDPGHTSGNPSDNAWGTTMSGPDEEQFNQPHQMGENMPNMLYSPILSSSTHSVAQLGSEHFRPELKPDPDSLLCQQEQQLPGLWDEPPIDSISRELEQAMKLEDSDGTFPSTPTALTSPSTTSHYSFPNSPCHSSGTPSESTSIMVDHTSPGTSSEFSEGDPPIDPPYSQLIFRALYECENHMMPLQELYAWFKNNTNKGKEQGNGWQNSIRHNLSMNAVRTLHFTTNAKSIIIKVNQFKQGFRAIKSEEKHVPGKRVVNYWSLTAEALLDGKVESTTRYRRSNPKKSPKSDGSNRRRGHGGINKGKGKEKVKGKETRSEHEEHQHFPPSQIQSQAQNQNQAQTQPPFMEGFICQHGVPGYQMCPMSTQMSPVSTQMSSMSPMSQMSTVPSMIPISAITPATIPQVPVPMGSQMQVYSRIFGVGYDSVTGCTPSSQNSPMFGDVDPVPIQEPVGGNYGWCNNGVVIKSTNQSTSMKEERWG
ncbi:hypothetical protein N7520_008789 [Penicillium odoratum]|uniref:uncharacterized protein n=1 Tax=Penicillium odoratum TaxID=1167516 RepID=UPI002548B1DC|nr:uncharacterized protein N7520_008789 [Penicillium odoratum]KAJ5751872.1 hypothetical protein N7520_008789 [Penicillium odoratum]